jgi:hypothetical protein
MDHGDLEHYLLKFNKNDIDGVKIITLEPNRKNINLLLEKYKVKGYTYIDLETGTLFSVVDAASINEGATISAPYIVIGKFAPNHEAIRALKLIRDNYNDFVKAFRYFFEYNDQRRKYEYKYVYNYEGIPDSEKPFYCDLAQKIRNEKLPFLDKDKVNEDDPGCYASRPFFEYILDLLYRLSYGDIKIEGYRIIFIGDNSDIKSIWEYVYSLMSKRGVLNKKTTKKYPDPFYFTFNKEKSDVFMANILNDLTKGDIKIDENKLKEDLLFTKAKHLCDGFKSGPPVSEDCVHAMEEFASYLPNAAKYDRLIGLVYQRMPKMNKEQIVRRYTKMAEGYEKWADLQIDNRGRASNLRWAARYHLFAGNKNKADQIMLQIQKEGGDICVLEYVFALNDENKYNECVKMFSRSSRESGNFYWATYWENKISDTYLLEHGDGYYKTLSPMLRKFAQDIQNYARIVMSYIYRGQNVQLETSIYDAAVILSYFPEDKKTGEMKIQQQFYDLILDNSDKLINTLSTLKRECPPEKYKKYDEFCLCAISYFNNKK